MTILLIMLALSNGVLVVLARMFNARLGREIGPAGASVWNHFTGFLVMAVFVLVLKGEYSNLAEIPLYAYLGGFIGAIYVTISNFLIPKIGASKATVLMIAGQITLATVIDFLSGKIASPLITAAGIILIISGVYVGETDRMKAS